MATHTIFGNNPVEIPAGGLTVAHDGADQHFRVGTLFYTSGAGANGWRCRGARIYLAADSGGDVMPATITLSLWVQPTLDVTTLTTPPLRTVTVDTTGRPGWFEGTWDSVEVIPGQKFMISYESGEREYQYVPGSNVGPYDNPLQASDGSSLYLSEMYGPNRGFFYDMVGGVTGGFAFYSGLDVLVDDDNTPPTAPTLTAVVHGQNIALSWVAATDDTAVTNYYVYRGVTPGFTADATSQIAVLGTDLTYDDVVFAVETYYYKVIARDIAQNQSAPSNEAVAVVTVGENYSLYPSGLGWVVGSTISDPIAGGQTLGTLFQLEAASLIVGVRFYSPVIATNVTAKLWGDALELLAQPNLTLQSGWNTCWFDTPYEGIPGANYRVSVFLADSPQVYTAQANMFSATRTQVGAAYSQTTSNGVYGPGDTLPTLDFQATWYGVDAIVSVSPARTGNVRVWNGTDWAGHPLKVWDGTDWTTHPASGYDGTDFIVGK